jgi:hypothetical protein
MFGLSTAWQPTPHLFQTDFRRSSCSFGEASLDHVPGIGRLLINFVRTEAKTDDRRTILPALRLTPSSPVEGEIE